MDKKEELKIIEDMQAVVAQMKADDIEENPACECETCKWQIEMSTPYRVMNPISIINDAILD